MKQPTTLLAALLLASCTSDSYTGGIGAADTPEADGVAIFIDGHSSNALVGSRAAGQDAATLLGGAFRVYATNSNGVVFNNYQVCWKGTDPATPTNLVGWEYQGFMSKADPAAIQQIKFWDLSAPRYDFVAFAGLDDKQKIASVDANTYTINATNMQNFYIANRVSATLAHAPAVEGVSPEFLAYGEPVKFTFRRSTSRIRVGFYETIPGYAVTDLRFYYGDNTSDADGTSTKVQAGLDGLFPEDGQFTITYDASNTAHTQFDAAGTLADNKTLGTLNYSKAESSVPGYPYLDADGAPSLDGATTFLGTASSSVTYAVADETIDGTLHPNSAWHPILPFEANTTSLSLRVDYTLIAIDGTGDQIKVKGAKAVVPISYCQWQPNYSYTYIFKISTLAGHTGNSDSPAGLYPITFDAEVSTITEFTDFETDLN